MKNSKPTIYDPAFLPNNIYSGVPSWLNLPVLENESELSSMDAVVTGVPWEGGCTIGGYSSCTEGPKAIRSVSIRYTGYLPDFDLDAFDYLKVGDFGAISIYGSVLHSLCLRRDLLAYAAVYGGFPFLRAVSRRMVCSPHRAPLRLPYGRKNVRGLSRGKAAQLQ